MRARIGWHRCFWSAVSSRRWSWALGYSSSDKQKAQFPELRQLATSAAAAGVVGSGRRRASTTLGQRRSRWWRGRNADIGRIRGEEVGKGSAGVAAVGRLSQHGERVDDGGESGGVSGRTSSSVLVADTRRCLGAGIGQVVRVEAYQEVGACVVAHDLVLVSGGESVAAAVDDGAVLGEEFTAEQQGQTDDLDRVSRDHQCLLGDDGGGSGGCRDDAAVAETELLARRRPADEAPQPRALDPMQVVVAPGASRDVASDSGVDDVAAKVEHVAVAGGGMDVERVHGVRIHEIPLRLAGGEGVVVVDLRLARALGVRSPVTLLAADLHRLVAVREATVLECVALPL